MESLKNLRLCLLVVCTGLGISTRQAEAAADFTWDGGAYVAGSQSTRYWSLGGNWNPDGVPAAGQSGLIDTTDKYVIADADLAGAPAIEVAAGGSVVHKNNVTLTSPITLSGGTWHTSAWWTTDNKLDLAWTGGRYINGPITVTSPSFVKGVRGTSMVINGQIDGNALLTIKADDSYQGDGLSLTISHANNPISGGVLIDAGNNPKVTVTGSQALGTGDITVRSTGTLTFGANQDYSGTVRTPVLYLEGGVTGLGDHLANAAIPFDVAVQSQGGTFGAGPWANNCTYSGAVTLNGPLTLVGSRHDAGYTNFKVSGAITGNYPVTVNTTDSYNGGRGIVTLSNAANSFAGLTLQRGFVKVTSEGALSSGPVTLYNRDTMTKLYLDKNPNADWTISNNLSGTGIIQVETGSGNTLATSGAISPGIGAGNVGTITVQGNLSFATGATLTVDLNAVDPANPAADRLVVSGNVNNLANATVTIAVTGDVSAINGREFTILTCANDLTAQSFADVVVPEGWSKAVVYTNGAVKVTVAQDTGSDSVAPAAVTNLAAGNATLNSLTLTWTAPGDDGVIGTAAIYEIRYATSTITEANWADATVASGVPAPAVAGTSQSVVVSGLAQGTTYYFAMKASDEVPNVSSLSNVAAGQTEVPDVTAPAAVTNLAASNPVIDALTLTWTAPGDDGSTGTASSYDIRYSTSAITEANWASATQVTGEPTAAAAGTAQNMTVSGLSAGTTYYFAIKTSDEVPNISAISNSPSGTTSTSASGTGLQGEYFNNANLTSLVRTRIDATVDFSWGTGSPDPAIDVDTFSVRWTGQVQAQYTETYTFYTYSDDGVRLWVNGQQLVNNWTDHAPIENSGTIALTAGQKYDITMEYYEASSGATARLLWSSLSTTKQVIPQAQLYPPVGGDTTPPAAVTNLAAGSPTASSLRLTWTAPGDDGNTSTAATYDIRYRTDGAVNESNWASATQVTGEPTPAVAGTSQNMVVSSLSAGTTYYFALKTADEVPNTSAISNSPSGTTAPADNTAPAAVTNLAASNPTPTSITLTWTAPGDDDSIGTAASYDIRYRTGGPVDDSNWASASQVFGEPAPAAAGTTQTMVVGSLDVGTTYYFAMRTSDETPNVSVLSNVVSGTTQPGPWQANKPLLSQADFRYRGYFSVPTGGSFADLHYGQGFTHRYVNGQLRFLTTSFFGNVPGGGYHLIEFLPPASLGGTATFSNHWPNIWQGTGMTIGMAWVGLWYEEAKSRLWSTWATDYPGDEDALWSKSIVVRTIHEDGTVSNVHGPYGLQTMNNRRIYGGIQAIPQWFQDFYQVGPYAAGWGGYASRMSYGCSMGPTFYAIPEPTGYPTGNDGIPTTAFKTLMDHISGTRATDWYASGAPTTFDRGVRNTDYRNEYEPSWQSPAPDGLGRWVWGDSNWNTGCWIETPTRHGFITVPKFSNDRVWYEWARLNCQSQSAEIQVFDPKMLGEVALGTRANWNTYPTSRWEITGDCKPLGLLYGIPGNSPQAGPCGASYDPTTRQLYVYAVWGAGAKSYVLIYDVGPIPGDVNADGHVNVGDLQGLVAAWGTTSTTTPVSGNWNGDADLNGDGYVNVGDLQLLVAHWGEQRQ